MIFFFLMIRRPPTSTPHYSSAAADVYKRQRFYRIGCHAAFGCFATDIDPVSYTHLRAHETKANLVCRLLLEKKKNTTKRKQRNDQHKKIKKQKEKKNARI